MYNSQSIQENHHVAAVMTAMADTDDINILGSLSKEKAKEARAYIISGVLGTDMTKHMEMIQHLSAQIAVNGRDAPKWLEVRAV